MMKHYPPYFYHWGSTLFEKMAIAASNLGDGRIKANILVVGDPLEKSI